MIKFEAAGWRSRYSKGKIQPTLLFLLGLGFVTLGLRIYPAFVIVGCLFLVIGYRGYTCKTRNKAD